MKRKIFTVLSLMSLAIVATGCGNLSEPTPTTSTVTATNTETATVTSTKTETARRTIVETTTETARQTFVETKTKTATNTVTVTGTITVTSPVPEPTSPTPTPEPNACVEAYGGWSTLEDSTAITMVRGDIYDVRIGRHDCFDRIVIDVDTTEDVGYHARYVPEVRQFGSGLAVPVDGGAALELIIDAPLAMSVYDNPPEAFTVTPNWDTLREVKNAGTFEGITKFAIGVDSQVKFGVYHHTGSTGNTHVVIDLVHLFE